ncbi:MAG: hypothetical protein LBS62_10080 [Clostridiales bacterium]|jgi:hypothetical protein|nr:hypothetical protein [Clostridiales bacterium]
MKKALSFILVSSLAALTLTACGGGGNYKNGLGIVTHIDSSASATDEAGPKGQVDSYIASITIDDSGKIVKCSLDVAQTQVNFDASGAITSDVNADVRSKQELKDEYGMLVASGIGKEWYEQANAFEAWATGKTLDQVKGLRLKDNNGHNVPDIPELTASVTVDVSDFIKAIEKAFANAE